jgi:sulfite reductase (ferredoxin)
MRTLAVVARTRGNGILHVTTRQDIQVHQVTLDQLHPALTELYAAGLSSKGGGGNTVRNITACYWAGVCQREAFDVAPYAVAVTEHLIPDPLSYRLPRKYKIAFSGCGRDCAGATVNDLGFIAKMQEEIPGFSIYVAGGMGSHSRVGTRFESFVPAMECHLVAEAIKRVFDRYGNRKNKHRARLRFLMDEAGPEQFRSWYEAAREELRGETISPPDIRPLPQSLQPVADDETPPLETFDSWRDHTVQPQKQEGYYLVQIPLFLGDVTADRLEALADIIDVHGEGMIRTTPWQNLVIHWVHQNELPSLHRQLAGLDLAADLFPVIRNMIACTGAATCKLGLCLSRGVAQAIREKVTGAGLDLNGMDRLGIYINGCPNACGRHPIGQIGLYGTARRVSGRLVPHYIIQLGGRVAEGRTRLASGNLAVPARNVPAFIADFLQVFQKSPLFPDYDSFLEDQGRSTAATLAATYKSVPLFEEDKSYYYDWSSETIFSLAGRGPGECGIGVFDLIEVDLASAHEAVKAGKLQEAIILAARALLITQGQEARNDIEVLDLFTTYFLDENLLHESFNFLIATARTGLGQHKPASVSGVGEEQVSSLVQAVQALYDTMDSSLRFQPSSKATALITPAETAIHRQADFRGVTCPLNYMKTRLLLQQMSGGEVLEVLLDQEGARNVPASAANDGHTVLSVEQQEDRWRVVIQKK